MPLAIDPDVTVELVLRTDAGKTSPPMFVFRHLSGRQWRALRGLMDRLRAAADMEAILATVDEIAAVLAGRLLCCRRCVDEEGHGNVLNAEALAILRPAEVAELAGALMDAAGPTAADQSKSPSPSGSDSESPARGTADAGAAT